MKHSWASNIYGTAWISAYGEATLEQEEVLSLECRRKKLRG